MITLIELKILHFYWQKFKSCSEFKSIKRELDFTVLKLIHFYSD